MAKFDVLSLVDKSTSINSLSEIIYWQFTIKEPSRQILQANCFHIPQSYSLRYTNNHITITSKQKIIVSSVHYLCIHFQLFIMIDCINITTSEGRATSGISFSTFNQLDPRLGLDASLLL